MEGPCSHCTRPRQGRRAPHAKSTETRLQTFLRLFLIAIVIVIAIVIDPVSDYDDDRKCRVCE